MLRFGDVVNIPTFSVIAYVAFWQQMMRFGNTVNIQTIIFICLCCVLATNVAFLQHCQQTYIYAFF